MSITLDEFQVVSKQQIYSVYKNQFSIIYKFEVPLFAWDLGDRRPAVPTWLFLMVFSQKAKKTLPFCQMFNFGRNYLRLRMINRGHFHTAKVTVTYAGGFAVFSISTYNMKITASSTHKAYKTKDQ